MVDRPRRGSKDVNDAAAAASGAARTDRETSWIDDARQDSSIAANRVPTFKALTDLDSAQFYAVNSGTNYAASRYLLYYLQEHGKLREFYRAFRAAHAKDPTGYATLVATLGVDDMTKFEKRWRAYVAKLTFP